MLMWIKDNFMWHVFTLNVQNINVTSFSMKSNAKIILVTSHDHLLIPLIRSILITEEEMYNR